MSEPTNQEVLSAVGELRLEVDKMVSETKGYDPEKIARIQGFLDEAETANQAFVTESKAAEKRDEETKERMDALEAELARKGPGLEGKNAYKETDEYKALDMYFRKGPDASAESKALLRSDSSVDGGVLVTTEMDTELIRLITEIDPFRSVCRVRSTAAKSLEMPIRTAILEAFYEGEAEQDEEGTSAYGSETITAFRLSVTVPATRDLLMDASFDMESEILADAAEAFAFKEGNLFVLGTGVKQPAGFVANPALQTAARDSAAADTLGGDDLILMTGDLKQGYNPLYGFNRRTLAFIRTLKGSDGHYLWAPGMSGAVASLVNGYPYLIGNSMPDIATLAYPVVFADFRRGYTITDRTATSVIRDELTRKRTAIIEFTIHRWNNGQVVVEEAFKLLKIKA